MGAFYDKYQELIETSAERIRTLLCEIIHENGSTSDTMVAVLDAAERATAALAAATATAVVDGVENKLDVIASSAGDQYGAKLKFFYKNPAIIFSPNESNEAPRLIKTKIGEA